MSLGIWATSSRPVTCTTLDCGAVVPAGTAFRRVGLSAVCAPCAAKRFGVELDTAPPNPYSAAAFRDRLAGFVTSADLALDWKQRQLPAEREPGEEG